MPRNSLPSSTITMRLTMVKGGAGSMTELICAACLIHPNTADPSWMALDCELVTLRLMIVLVCNLNGLVDVCP